VSEQRKKIQAKIDYLNVEAKNVRAQCDKLKIKAKFENCSLTVRNKTIADLEEKVKEYDRIFYQMHKEHLKLQKDKENPFNLLNK
jgi:peptidoglycan hydrolase CwlO-like protein